MAVWSRAGVGDKSRVLFATTSECVLEHVVSVCLANMWGKWLENIARGMEADQEEDRKLCYMDNIKLFVCKVVVVVVSDVHNDLTIIWGNV